MSVRIATYARVSTTDQVDTGTSLADQERRLRAAVTARDGHLVDHFTDAGVSGVLDSRPGLDRLRKTVNAGGVDLLMATKIDRVSRSAVGLLALIEELRHANCHLVLIDEGLDTSTAAGDLTSGLLGVIGGWERARIAERTKAGRRAAAETEGRFVGSTPPFGYQAVPATSGRGMRLDVHDAQAATVRRLFEIVVVHKTPLPLAVTALNQEGHHTPRGQPWTLESLARWVMRREPLRAAGGIWVFDGIDTQIPAILTPAQLWAWQEWQDDRRRPGDRTRGPYLLAGMVTMPCGRTAMGRTAGRQTPTYSCRRHYLPKGDPQRHDRCTNISCPLLDEVVTDHIRTDLAHVDLLREAARQRLHPSPDTDTDTTPSLRSQLRQVEKCLTEEARLFRAQGYSGPTLVAVLQPLHEQRQALTRQITRTQRQARSHNNQSNQDTETAHLAHQMRDGIRHATPHTWRQILRTLQVNVTINSYRTCPTCGGSGYLPLPPGNGRRYPPSCQACLHGNVPNLTIEYDDITAIALLNDLDEQVS